MMCVLLAVALVSVCLSQSSAIPFAPFINADTYIKKAEDIVVAKCISDPGPVPRSDRFVQIDIELVLKGQRKPGKATIFTTSQIQPGKRYLLMNSGGQAGETSFLAVDELSVVPIPSFVDLNTLKQKNLKDQLHYLFASRLYIVQRELEPLLRDRSALQKALADRTDNLYVSPRSIHFKEILTTAATVRQGGEVPSLDFNSRRMEWSRQSDQSGYLYSVDPVTRRPSWEFASTDQQSFRELEGKKIEARFSLATIPPGGDTIVVRPGQMFLARYVDDPDTIYAIRIAEQDGDKVSAEYAIIGGDQAATQKNKND